MGITALSKILGLFRFSRLASLLGLSELSSAFTLAQRIPAMLSETLILAAIPGCFIPLYAAEKQTQKNTATVYLRVVLFFSFSLTVLGVLFAEPLVLCFAPGLSPTVCTQTITLLRLSFPSVIFSGVTALITALFQANRRFALPALAGCIANLFAVITLTFFEDVADTATLLSLTLVLQASPLLQLLFLVLPILRKPLFARTVSEAPQMLWQIFKRAPFVTVTASLLPLIRVLLFHVMGKVAPYGTAVADYATLPVSAVSGILIAGTVNLSFPHLAACRSQHRFRIHSAKALSDALLFSVPVALLLCFFAGEIVTAFYQHGRFSQADTIPVSEVLSVLSLSLPFLSVNEMLRRIADATASSHRLLPLLVIGPLPLLIFGCLPGSSLRDIAFAHLLSQGCITLFSCLMLHRVIAFRHCFRALPPMLIGAASLALCYLLFNRWFHFSASPLLFPCLTTLCGLLFYLIFCRPLFCGRERRPQRNEFSQQEKGSL